MPVWELFIGIKSYLWKQGINLIYSIIKFATSVCLLTAMPYCPINWYNQFISSSYCRNLDIRSYISKLAVCFFFISIFFRYFYGKIQQKRAELDSTMGVRHWAAAGENLCIFVRMICCVCSNYSSSVWVLLVYEKWDLGILKSRNLKMGFENILSLLLG